MNLHLVASAGIVWDHHGTTIYRLLGYNSNYTMTHIINVNVRTAAPQEFRPNWFDGLVSGGIGFLSGSGTATVGTEVFGFVGGIITTVAGGIEFFEDRRAARRSEYLAEQFQYPQEDGRVSVVMVAHVAPGFIRNGEAVFVGDSRRFLPY